MSGLPHDLDAVGLLLLVHRLQSTGRPLTRDTILPFAALKLPGVERNYPALVAGLLDQGLAEGTPDAFNLTLSGEAAVAAAAREHSLNALFYNEYYRAVAASPAHAEFCARVYGRDLCQHGMTDMDQIHSLLAALGVSAASRLLDFGCGDGRIAEYISDTTGATVAGVDIAGEAIHLAQERTRAKRARLSFHCADIDKGAGDLPAGPFDAVLAIDSIFFTADLANATRRLRALLKPGGRLAVFYHAPAGVAAEATRFARVLGELGLAYQVSDLSAANAAHWEKKKAALLELAPHFAAEGNLFLYKNRMAECEGGLGAMQRYLYLTRGASS